jgi:osmotically-inducible protein OsmY
MKNTFKTMLLVSALALPMASFAADGDSLGTKVEDSVITAKVKAAFAKDKTVSATDISVETDSNGLVQLTGNAKSRAEADKAVQLTKKVKGVTAVKDDIVVAQ